MDDDYDDADSKTIDSGLSLYLDSERPRDKVQDSDTDTDDDDVDDRSETSNVLKGFLDSADGKVELDI